VNCAEVRLALAKRHNDTADAVVKLVAVAATEASLGVHKEYESMVKHVNQPPHDIESLTATQEFIKGLGDKVKDVQVKHEANSSLYAALEAAAFPLSKDMFEALMKSKAGAVKVWKAVGEQERALELERARYGEELASEQSAYGQLTQEFPPTLAGQHPAEHRGSYQNRVQVVRSGVARAWMGIGRRCGRRLIGSSPQVILNTFQLQRS
jgi:hypothetical protein